LKKYLTIDFGQQGEYRPLYGETFSVKANEYTYELKPFDIAKQVGGSHVNLGYWGSWNAPNVMVYDKGERCWGGPERSLTVTVECNDIDDIMDVREPSKCEYTMLYKTPSACSPQGLTDLEAELKNKEI